MQAWLVFVRMVSILPSVSSLYRPFLWKTICFCWSIELWWCSSSSSDSPPSIQRHTLTQKQARNDTQNIDADLRQDKTRCEIKEGSHVSLTRETRDDQNGFERKDCPFAPSLYLIRSVSHFLSFSPRETHWRNKMNGLWKRKRFKINASSFLLPFQLKLKHIL